MLRKLVVICTIICFGSILAFGQETEAAKGEFFAGYQYFHATTGVSGVDGFSLNGWNASMSGFFTRNLGVTADFSGSYGSPSGVSVKLHSFLFGPTVRFPNTSRITPFAHALFGGGHITASALGLSGGETDFTWAAGGGIDVNATRHLAIRLGQADFLQTRASGQSQNHFRYSAGIVFKF
jgi:opacity protein-like surface antigen